MIVLHYTDSLGSLVQYVVNFHYYLGVALFFCDIISVVSTMMAHRQSSISFGLEQNVSEDLGNISVFCHE